MVTFDFKVLFKVVPFVGLALCTRLVAPVISWSWCIYIKIGFPSCRTFLFSILPLTYCWNPGQKLEGLLVPLNIHCMVCVFFQMTVLFSSGSGLQLDEYVPYPHLRQTRLHFPFHQYGWYVCPSFFSRLHIHQLNTVRPIRTCSIERRKGHRDLTAASKSW